MASLNRRGLCLRRIHPLLVGYLLNKTMKILEENQE
jgi:hypothetical protein